MEFMMPISGSMTQSKAIATVTISVPESTDSDVFSRRSALLTTLSESRSTSLLRVLSVLPYFSAGISILA